MPDSRSVVFLSYLIFFKTRFGINEDPHSHSIALDADSRTAAAGVMVCWVLVFV